MTVREALPTDATHIAAIEAECAATGAWSTAMVAGSLASPAAKAWVTLDVDQVVGHLITTIAADEAEVLLLAVHPLARRRGHAKALLREGQTHWRDCGVRLAWLDVRADNVAALALYEGVGFAAAHRRKAYYADGTDGIVMRWAP